LDPKDRDPKVLMANGSLEKLEDFEYDGKKVLASRLGYRITSTFSLRCLNRLFDEPNAVFNEKMLKPELQGIEDYVDGIANIVEAQQKVALSYFEDGSIEAAIPPLKIVLHMMAYGTFEGKDMSDPELRGYFERDSIINSDWYKERLQLKQQKDINFYTNQISYLERFISNEENHLLVAEMDLDSRLQNVRAMLATASSPDYIDSLVGTIGADPLYRK
jgi:hypothetical protein